MYFLIVATEKVSVASPVKVRADVQQPLDQGGVLRHAAHVQDILPVILLRQVNVIQEQRVPLQHPGE